MTGYDYVSRRAPFESRREKESQQPYKEMHLTKTDNTLRAPKATTAAAGLPTTAAQSLPPEVVEQDADKRASALFTTVRCRVVANTTCAVGPTAFLGFGKRACVPKHAGSSSRSAASLHAPRSASVAYISKRERSKRRVDYVVVYPKRPAPRTRALSTPHLATTTNRREPNR